MISEHSGRKKRSSMRTELSIIVVAVIVCALGIVGIATYFGLAPFYRHNMISKLVSTYRKIDALTDDYEDFTKELYQIAEQDNIRITVTDSEFTKYESTTYNGLSYVNRLFGYMTGFYRNEVDIVKSTELYTIQETQDEKVEVTYLEMWGRLSDEGWFIIATPLESITHTAHLSMVFFVLVGLMAIAASIFVIYVILGRYTRPLASLTEQARRMANLEFDAHYTGDDANEIGELGQSFNKMSDELERAISELKSANVELQRDNERKTKVDEVRKEFLNNVSHELKTPIALIQGYAEGLKDNIAEDADSRDFYCDVIIDEAAKMNVMVKKLLTLNQLEFGNDQIVMDRFDLVQLIRGVMEGMQIMIDEAEAKVSFAENGPVYVWGDEFQIEEVVTNYLSNALHHVSGKKLIEIRIELSGTIARTTVFNTGQPIPEEDLDRVFEKFYKVDKARTREYGGSGIGLSIVKAVMDGHHQLCGVRNYENGVAFWFTLERCSKDRNQQPASAKMPYKPA